MAMKIGDLVKCREVVRQWSSNYADCHEATGIVIGIYSLEEDTFLKKINLRVLGETYSPDTEAVVDIRLPDGTIQAFDIKDCKVISKGRIE